MRSPWVVVDPLHERGHILEGHPRCPALALNRVVIDAKELGIGYDVERLKQA